MAGADFALYQVEHQFLQSSLPLGPDKEVFRRSRSGFTLSYCSLCHRPVGFPGQSGGGHTPTCITNRLTTRCPQILPVTYLVLASPRLPHASEHLTQINISVFRHTISPSDIIKSSMGVKALSDWLEIESDLPTLERRDTDLKTTFREGILEIIAPLRCSK
ncbi:hypothetical protein ASPWEDRAFT_237938 [Aspergillus wentii DTO 134E9]|uniref:Uncharacterized protein n=1 Tax=Aspergillus wentii DTO 134E9 TaxID=1073089 RepID=A0A1L9S182_ASPWE|nr:uncharacterized protein ASPWEDRAFT_237938 [Aspergillus wentii DTO 134E9]OJJ40930.1 hypothetical protein ASPWEDRAFT_237938 [Aspergillus wentii DTO 134E9]